MQIIRTRKRLMAATAVAAAALTTASLAGMGTAGAATNLGHRPHPHYTGANVTGTVQFVNDQFQGNIGGFCAASPPNAPCDGNALAGDFGTIDSVSSKFSNGGFGNYAPSTHSLDGSQMALVSGTTAENQGQPCPTPGTEGCTGPYWVPTSAETVFPAGGFTVTADVYLDTNAQVGEIDPDVAMSNSSGAYGQDMISRPAARAPASGGRSPPGTTLPVTAQARPWSPPAAGTGLSGCSPTWAARCT